MRRLWAWLHYWLFQSVQGISAGLAAPLWPPRNAVLGSHREALGSVFLQPLTPVKRSATAKMWFGAVREDVGDGVRGAPAGKWLPSGYERVQVGGEGSVQGCAASCLTSAAFSIFSIRNFKTVQEGNASDSREQVLG